jgi:hypothetical protein
LIHPIVKRLSRLLLRLSLLVTWTRPPATLIHPIVKKAQPVATKTPPADHLDAFTCYFDAANPHLERTSRINGAAIWRRGLSNSCNGAAPAHLAKACRCDRRFSRLRDRTI